jgi:hypothetical protein
MCSIMERNDTPSVLINWLRSRCVPIGVKRLKVLITCREFWVSVSLVTNRPEEWIYLPPHVFGSFGYLVRCVGIHVAGQPGVWSCSRATGIRPAHIGCACGPAVACGGPVH